MKCSTLKYLARLEEERSGTVEKSADYLVEFLKEQCKPYFSSYRDTITNLKAPYNVVGYVEGIDPVLKRVLLIVVITIISV
jgi:hypothetical protein